MHCKNVDLRSSTIAWQSIPNPLLKNSLKIVFNCVGETKLGKVYQHPTTR